MQKYGCMLKISSFGAILLAYDKIAHEGAQNEPNLPLCPQGVQGKNKIAHVTLRWQTNKTFKQHLLI